MSIKSRIEAAKADPSMAISIMKARQNMAAEAREESKRLNRISLAFAQIVNETPQDDPRRCDRIRQFEEAAAEYTAMRKRIEHLTD